MLPKQVKLRLRTQPEFFRASLRVRTPDVVLWFQPVAPELNTRQVAVLVPKKIARLANNRNRTKRVWRAAVLSLLRGNLLPAGKWVIQPQRSSIEFSVQAAEKALQGGIQKIATQLQKKPSV